jgi:hypothetical protein
MLKGSAVLSPSQNCRVWIWEEEGSTMGRMGRGEGKREEKRWRVARGEGYEATPSWKGVVQTSRTCSHARLLHGGKNQLEELSGPWGCRERDEFGWVDQVESFIEDQSKQEELVS